MLRERQHDCPLTPCCPRTPSLPVRSISEPWACCTLCRGRESLADARDSTCGTQVLDTRARMSARKRCISTANSTTYNHPSPAVDAERRLPTSGQPSLSRAPRLPTLHRIGWARPQSGQHEHCHAQDAQRITVQATTYFEVNECTSTCTDGKASRTSAGRPAKESAPSGTKTIVEQRQLTKHVHTSAFPRG